MPRKPRLTKQQFKTICEQLAEGRSLMKICSQDESLPSWRTVLRHIQEDDESHEEYRKARAIQAEMLRDEIIEIIEAPLPDDPKLAQAEVGRRRLEVEQKDKYVRQLQPLGIRNKAADQDSKVQGTITLKWGEE